MSCCYQTVLITLIQGDSLARGPKLVYLQIFNELVNKLTDTLLLFQLDTLLFSFIHLQFFYSFSLHVSDRLVHHQENQITRAASGTFPSFVVISCVAVGAN